MSFMIFVVKKRMTNNQRQSGMTLTELLVVVAVMAILLGISVPTAQHLMDSFESSTGVRHLINAALSNARAIAVRQQAYAGVRFQQGKDGKTYMIFIVKDEDATGLANGFRAVEGRKPMQLPEDVGVISPYWIDRTGFNPNNWSTLVPILLNDAFLNDNTANFAQVWGKPQNLYLLDASTFSIMFSPQGKLTTHPAWVRNKDGQTNNSSNDTIFNVEDAANVMFLQDDYTNFGIGPETSVQSFKIYSKKQYRQTPANSRWLSYLSILNLEYISPYTGELVMEYREQNP